MIRKRSKNTYEVTIDIGFDNNGKRKRKYESIRGSIKDARAREAEMRALYKNGQFIVNNSYTVKSYIDKWLTLHVEATLAPKTIESYKGLAGEFVDELGHLKLKTLTPLHLIEFYNNLRQRNSKQKEFKGKNKKLSERTIQRYYNVINKALNHAVQWQIIAYNPNQQVDRPRPLKKEAKYYDEEQTRELLRCLDKEKIKNQAIVRLALDLGCRRGELTGLNWEDIDLNNGIVSINKVTQYVNKKIIEKTTKNASSIRKVYITTPTIDVLKEYKKYQNNLKLELKNKWGGSPKVFTTNDGNHMHPDTPSKLFREMLKKHKLPIINFHSLRHTSASLQLFKGIGVADISRRLGHAETSTTLNIYSHSFHSSNEKIITEFTNIFNTKEG